MKKYNIQSLLFYVISAEVIGGVSALITGSFSDFFDVYRKPALLPPGWLFPVVWIILYALMGFSAYLITVSSARPDEKKSALIVYWAQLAFNFSWSIVFFRFQWLWGAVGVIACLISLIAVMIVMFLRIEKRASILNIPYFVWVVFATYLNIATALIN